MGFPGSILPAELTDDIDYVRAAALRKLVPYSLVDLFLREEPARVLGQVSQCKELQMREIQGPHFTVCLRRWSSIPRKVRVASWFVGLFRHLSPYVGQVQEKALVHS